MDLTALAQLGVGGAVVVILAWVLSTGRLVSGKQAARNLVQVVEAKDQVIGIYKEAVTTATEALRAQQSTVAPLLTEVASALRDLNRMR